MTLASDTRNPSPERFGESKSTFGARAQAEPLPPTLLRLPSLSSSVAAAVESTTAHASDCERAQKVGASSPPVVPAEASAVPSQSIDAAITHTPSTAPTPAPSTAPTPAPSRTAFLTRVIQRDYNVAGLVDRVATRKTLSAALVVVAGLAIWMPRGGDSNNTIPAHLPGSSDVVGASPSFPSSEESMADVAMTLPRPTQSHSHDVALGATPNLRANQAGIQPGFSDRMVQTKSAPMESAALLSPANTHENAVYDMDPMASAANDQIRRMDATYADLPSVSAMDSVAFETEAESPAEDVGDESGPLNLVMSPTPEPIVNWAAYLPPVDAEDYSEQVASSPPPTAPAMGRTVAAKKPPGAVQTTALPTAPDFGLALPGDDQLIEADAHVAMPPLGSEDQTQRR